MELQEDYSAPTGTYLVQDYNVSMYGSPRVKTTPSLGTFNNSTILFDTTDIAKQLGATSNQLSVDDRNILQLIPNENIIPTKFPETYCTGVACFTNYSNPLNGSTWVQDQVTGVTKYTPFSISMFMDPGINIHDQGETPGRSIYDAMGSPTLVSLFGNVIAETGSPAKALQAIMTTMYRASYYQWISGFTKEANTTSTVMFSALIPVYRRGYIGAIVIIASHLLVCLVIAVMFIVTSRKSLLGNSFFAIALVANNPDTANYIKHYDHATDREVEALIKRQHTHTELHRRRWFPSRKPRVDQKEDVFSNS
jgi:hypothetical protein